MCFPGLVSKALQIGKKTRPSSVLEAEGREIAQHGLNSQRCFQGWGTLRSLCVANFST